MSDDRTHSEISDEEGDNDEDNQTVVKTGDKRPHEDDTAEEETPSKQRYCLLTTSTQGDEWELPDELAEFLKSMSNKFVPEKDLEQFLEVPAPKNFDSQQKMDPFMRALLEKRGKNRLVSVDDELQKVHHRSIQALGPLGKVWSDIQDFVTGNSEEESLEPEKVVTNLNSAVALLCQAIHKLSYERRLAALTVSSDLKTARRQLIKFQNFIFGYDRFIYSEQKRVQDLPRNA